MGCCDAVARFIDETAALGEKRGAVLVQLPPSLAFDPSIAEAFFASVRGQYTGALVCEPRHASWFDEPGDALLRRFGVVRAAVDPAVVPDAALPGGARLPGYYRWHGSPQTYVSRYDDATLRALATAIAEQPETWCIFDNTTLGAATENARTLQAILHDGSR